MIDALLPDTLLPVPVNAAALSSRASFDAMHTINSTLDNILEWIPEASDQQLIELHEYAKGLGSRAFLIADRCIAEAQRRSCHNTNAIAKEFGLAARTARESAQRHNTFFADDEKTASGRRFLEVSDEKSFLTVAMAAPDPMAALEEITENIISNPHFSKREAKEIVQRMRFADMPEPTLPQGKFSVFYADPPWQYDFSLTANRQIENHYPTMTVEEICRLPIGEMANEDAVIYLWGTNPKLLEAVAVLAAWGFEYKTNMVWVKPQIGGGYWARQRHELLLIATRGAFSPPPPAIRPHSVIEAPRMAHSAKPLEVAELLETLYPSAPKVELFCRAPRPGWTAWGNQAGQEN